MEFQFMQHGYITKYFLQPSKDIKTIPNIWSVLKHDRPHLVLGTVACWFLQPAHEQVSLQNCFREAGVCAALSCLLSLRSWSRLPSLAAYKGSASLRTSTDSCVDVTQCLLLDLPYSGLEIHLLTYINYILQHKSV